MAFYCRRFARCDEYLTIDNGCVLSRRRKRPLSDCIWFGLVLLNLPDNYILASYEDGNNTRLRIMRKKRSIDGNLSTSSVEGTCLVQTEANNRQHESTFFSFFFFFFFFFFWVRQEIRYTGITPASRICKRIVMRLNITVTPIKGYNEFNTAITFLCSIIHLSLQCRAINAVIDVP